MARPIHKLTSREVEALVRKGTPCRKSDGGGAYLKIDEGRARWTFRSRFGELGLGAAGAGGVTLKAMREKAAAARDLVRAGKNPRDVWAKDEKGVATFGALADEYLAAHEGSFRNAKHTGQWRMTLTRYCESVRSTPVDKVDTEAVLAVLKPLWTRAPETASRLRGRIEAVLDAARARGFIAQNQANPARWRGHLDKLLPKRGILSRGHHAAMPYAEVPAFIVGLRGRRATAARALEFIILTAARSGEVLGARWGEIDLGAKVWTIPAARTKAGRDHRVPLADCALALLEEMADRRRGDYVFPGQRPGRPLSGAAFEMLRRRIGLSYTAHGFRSSFRDWAGNEAHFARELAEQALAHAVGDSTERAYRRSDALARRRELMDAWARYCEGGAKVLSFHSAGGPPAE